METLTHNLSQSTTNSSIQAVRSHNSSNSANNDINHNHIIATSSILKPIPNPEQTPCQIPPHFPPNSIPILPSPSPHSGISFDEKETVQHLNPMLSPSPHTSNYNNHNHRFGPHRYKKSTLISIQSMPNHIHVQHRSNSHQFNTTAPKYMYFNYHHNNDHAQHDDILDLSMISIHHIQYLRPACL